MSNEKKKETQVDKDFPICIFPEKLQEILTELERDRLFPLEYIASAVLFVISVLIGSGSYLWTILGKAFANLFVAIIGDQGTNKSTPIEWALTPLLEADHNTIETYNKKMEEWNAQNQKYSISRNEADKPGPRPGCIRMLCTDTTPEVLVHLMAANPLGIGQYQDELTRLFTCLARYNNGGSNEDLLLQFFSGKPITVDRATREQVISVLRPFYSLIGTIQPKRFLKIMLTNNRYESGLFSRFLLCSNFDNSALEWNLVEDLPSDVDERYKKIINAFLERRNNTNPDTPVEYKLSSDAVFVIQSWQNNHEKRIEESGRDTDRAVFRKSQIYVLKFALILQILWDVCEHIENPNHVVSDKTAILATLLTDYYYRNAKEIGRSLDCPRLSAAEKFVFDALPEKFTTAQGREIAKRMGLGKTCFHQLINKVKGTELLQPSRGVYKKKNPLEK